MVKSDNKKMNKGGIKINNKMIAVVVGAVFLVVALAAVVATRQSGKKAGVTTGAPGEFTQTDTRRAVPEGIKVPGVGEAVESKEIAVPTVVTSAAPGVSAKLRAFTILADKGKFEPSKIVANKGDTINIVIEAVDGDYDFVLPDFGMMQVMAKGQKKVVEFQATSEGQFVYYCESCGGINSSAKGTITIVP